jgi:enoyl-CoA hydratase/carnithine racemase
LYRFLLSYQYDNAVENVWLQSKENVFSHGVDYKRLAEDKHYLDKVSKLAILLARFNKPTFGQIAGGSKGVGAYLLSMLNMPLGYDNAFLKLDECLRGMVPLMGGSHRLARLPLHLGYYLALVGDELNAEDMAQLGFLKGAISEGVTNSQIRQKFHEANLYFR